VIPQGAGMDTHSRLNLLPLTLVCHQLAVTALA